MSIIRQGEVRMSPLSSIPACAMSKISATNGAIIVGESESHHHHVIRDNGAVDVMERTDNVQDGMKILYAIVKDPTVLEQTAGNPHAAHPIPSGNYEIRIKREFNPFLEQARRVAD
jgi:hypothetical protein